VRCSTTQPPCAICCPLIIRESPFLFLSCCCGGGLDDVGWGNGLQPPRRRWCGRVCCPCGPCRGCDVVTAVTAPFLGLASTVRGIWVWNKARARQSARVRRIVSLAWLGLMLLGFGCTRAVLFRGCILLYRCSASALPLLCLILLLVRVLVSLRHKSPFPHDSPVELAGVHICPRVRLVDASTRVKPALRVHLLVRCSLRVSCVGMLLTVTSLSFVLLVSSRWVGVRCGPGRRYVLRGVCWS